MLARWTGRAFGPFGYSVIVLMAAGLPGAEVTFDVLVVPMVMLVAVAVPDSRAFTRKSGTPLAANLLLVWLIPAPGGLLLR